MNQATQIGGGVKYMTGGRRRVGRPRKVGRPRVRRVVRRRSVGGSNADQEAGAGLLKNLSRVFAEFWLESGKEKNLIKLLC
jgi:hypothetical protein